MEVAPGTRLLARITRKHLQIAEDEGHQHDRGERDEDATDVRLRIRIGNVLLQTGAMMCRGMNPRERRPRATPTVDDPAIGDRKELSVSSVLKFPVPNCIAGAAPRDIESCFALLSCGCTTSAEAEATSARKRDERSSAMDSV